MSTTLQELVILAYKNQDELNKKLNPAWATQNWPYYRALWTEAAEAVQHIKSWLWWKDGFYGKPMSGETINHVRMELVDILHFGLSMDLVGAFCRPHPETVVRGLAESLVGTFESTSRKDPCDAEDVMAGLEGLVEYAISSKVFAFGDFAYACRSVGMDLEMTLALYFAKTTLNEFRYAHGYNLPAGDPDKYVKMWPKSVATADLHNRVEDNEVLQDIVTRLLEETDISPRADGLERFKEIVHSHLKDHYPG